MTVKTTTMMMMIMMMMATNDRNIVRPVVNHYPFQVQVRTWDHHACIHALPASPAKMMAAFAKRALHTAMLQRHIPC